MIKLGEGFTTTKPEGLKINNFVGKLTTKMNLKKKKCPCHKTLPLKKVTTDNIKSIMTLKTVTF